MTITGPREPHDYRDYNLWVPGKPQSKQQQNSGTYRATPCWPVPRAHTDPVADLVGHLRCRRVEVDGIEMVFLAILLDRLSPQGHGTVQLVWIYRTVCKLRWTCMLQFWAAGIASKNKAHSNIGQLALTWLKNWRKLKALVDAAAGSWASGWLGTASGISAGGGTSATPLSVLEEAASSGDVSGSMSIGNASPKNCDGENSRALGDAVRCTSSMAPGMSWTSGEEAAWGSTSTSAANSFWTRRCTVSVDTIRIIGSKRWCVPVAGGTHLA